jgi:hypothetical protein
MLTNSRVEALEARLSRIEARYARLKTALAIALVSCSGIFILGQASSRPPSISAEEFLVRDVNGRIVARLGCLYPTRDDTLSLQVDGKALKREACTTAGLSFFDSTSRTRAEFKVFPDGTPRLTIFGFKGLSDLSLGCDRTAGLLSATFRDSLGGHTLMLVCEDSGASSIRILKGGAHRVLIGAGSPGMAVGLAPGVVERASYACFFNDKGKIVSQIPKP